MKQQLPRATSPCGEDPKDLSILDCAEYSVGDTVITCRLHPVSHPSKEGCLISMISNRTESLNIRTESLEEGRRVFSLLVRNGVSLYHVADILEELEISATVSTSIPCR